MNQKDINDELQINKSFGLTTDRIQSLNDSIFAFAMTLLVLGFELPKALNGHQLAQELYALWPQFVTFALSFIALGGLWVAHHNQYYWIKRSNRSFLWINIFFLFFIVLIPFSTKMLAAYHNERLAVIAYGINLVICLSILYIHWVYATRNKRLTEDDINTHIVNLLRARMFLIILANILTLLIAQLSIRAGLFLLLLVQIFSIAPTISIDRFILGMERRLGHNHDHTLGIDKQ